MEKQEGTISTRSGLRRSARISELEENARLLALQKKAKVNNNNDSNNDDKGKSTSRRGRKRKSLQVVGVNSASIHFLEHHGEGTKPLLVYSDEGERKNQPISISSSPSDKWNQMLELILDILQRRDTREIFTHPINPTALVFCYYNVIKEPMDFGTMRAKLHGGRYASLEQFEYDVFLVCSNAMRFNAPESKFYTEARAISELAQQLFHSLRSDPEKFESEYLGIKRCDKKPTRPVSAGGVSTSKHRIIGDASNNPFFGEPNDVNSSEIEKRRTYRPQSSSVKEDDWSFSLVLNAPKQLQFNADAGVGYRESLMSFVKDLGPTAQMVASRKLAQLPNQSSSSCVDSPSSTLHLGGGIHHQERQGYQMPSHLSSCGSPPAASYKGMMVDHTSWAPTPSAALPTEACGSSHQQDQMGGSRDGMDDLISTIMQLGAIQNMSAQAPSGSFYPLTGADHEDVYAAPVQPQPALHQHHQFANTGVQGQSPWPTNNNLDGYHQLEPRWLPPQTRAAEVPTITTHQPQGTSSFFSAFDDSQGPSSNSANVPDHTRHGTNFGQSVRQPAVDRWNQRQEAWSLESICNHNPPVKQRQEQIRTTTPWDHQELNSAMVGQERPLLFDQSTRMMSFSSRDQQGAHCPQPQGVHGAAESSSRTFNTQPSSSRRGNQQHPDLNLQL
ncbi:hypothetical protein K2173_023722 [Erythroxylum novogranatense]|uniref:Bromo domain-containing protein n=1 Tax=Erythroxylum novogranatense TaxID=1862640 RepID=A0AAV8TRJ0_9ROSI|nr:hypothetical protein K2173_023722 [Erythroxylum novogranatense]